MSFQDFYQRCREAFLVNSDLTLRTQLTEFRDHKLIRTRKVKLCFMSEFPALIQHHNSMHLISHTSISHDSLGCRWSGVPVGSSGYEHIDGFLGKWRGGLRTVKLQQCVDECQLPTALVKESRLAGSSKICQIQLSNDEEEDRNLSTYITCTSLTDLISKWVFWFRQSVTYNTNPFTIPCCKCLFVALQNTHHVLRFIQIKSRLGVNILQPHFFIYRKFI